VRLAVNRQPLLEAQSAAVASAHQRAVADAQLPDPKLSFGVQDFPIDTRTAYSLRKDDFTMTTVELMQDFPRAQKRRLRGERGQREAEMTEQELEALRLSIPRDAALAWVDVWWPGRAMELARATAHDADLQAQAVEIAYRTGRATQADVLAARVDFQVVGDEVADWAQRAEQARNALSRWIGADADRQSCSSNRARTRSSVFVVGSPTRCTVCTARTRWRSSPGSTRSSGDGRTIIGMW